MSIRIRRGDLVQVISGAERGKTGRVLSVDAEKQRVIVEKLNFVKRHMKPRGSGMNQQSGIIEKEAPIHVSNVLLVDPKLGRGVRTGVRVNANGKRERISRKTGDVISKNL